MRRPAARPRHVVLLVLTLVPVAPMHATEATDLEPRARAAAALADTVTAALASEVLSPATRSTNMRAMEGQAP